MAKTVLITGATGLIGKHLSELLLGSGWQVHVLSRKPLTPRVGIRSFIWDPDKGTIDPKCIDDVSAVVHLAGEGIASKPWTKEQKKRLIKSRTDSIRLIYQLIGKHPSSNNVKTVVSASAVGYYGDRGDELLTESSNAGNDFMAQVCIAWERAVDEGSALRLRIVKLRTGIVLSSEGGALPRLAGPVKAGIGAPLGNGKQWVPWIHLHDAVRMYQFVLDNSLAEGTYNQAAPTPVTNRQLTKQIARQLKRPLWLPGIPALLLRIALGEMKAAVLSSTKTSSEKIASLGFNFRFNTLDEALSDLYNKK